MMSNRYNFDNEGVITSSEIKQILERYRIGKKPLAKLLGWGETTIIRYMEGDIPTNEYSIKLKTLLDNPEFYYDLLIKRQDCLTNVAFKKSKNAVLSKIMASKIYAAAYYIINKCDAEICPSYIQFLLYYIQAFSLALYDVEIFQEDYSINNEQMPYLKLYHTMKRCGINTLEVREEYLSEIERELVNAVHEAFSWYGPKALNTLMGIEKSALKISRDRHNNKIISKESIMQYFKDICEQYEIKTIDDIIKYPDQCIWDIRNN
ncbi:MAG: hypothetical protein EWM47_10895 [Anaerolineaceae bacterium]|nr:MAG: hypothetical protein EWM47_10895 [Anaerolineaceae bacterium]